MPREPEVDLGEVDEDGNIGPVTLDESDQLPVLRVYVWGVADDLREAHVRDIFGADDAFQASAGHLGATEASEAGHGQARAQMRDDPRSVVVSRGLASGEKYARIGVGSDAYEFISTLPSNVAEVR